MFKTAFAAAVALGGLALVALPAQAATGGASCTATDSVVGNEDIIAQRLTEQGYAVDGIEDWSGCVRAFVTKADGSIGMALFEPITLRPLAGDA
ncbi:hypothetical protein [Devosia sp.]|uniref:hypothetical protein n=1 Tax=Devosia sp. TaxID=1871048 RepID=UPI002AFEF13E|nr:hypothetical protein [Devosia sp.]